MTWYEILFLIVAGLSLLLLAWRYVTKFPLAARVDPGSLPEVKQESVKKQMLDQRLRRTVYERTKFVRSKFNALYQVIRNILVGLYNDLLEKEKQLRSRRLQSRSAATVGMNSLQQRLELLLTEAAGHMKKDEYAEAEKKYLEVISINPKSIEAFEGLGDMYLDLHKYAEAKETYEYLLKLTHAEAYFHDKLGQVARAQGHLQEAESQFQRSIQLNNQNAGYHFHLAEVFMSEGESDSAARELERALELEANNPKYLDALLNISIIRKDKVRAGEILLQFERINPENQKLPDLREQVENL